MIAYLFTWYAMVRFLSELLENLRMEIYWCFASRYGISSQSRRRTRQRGTNINEGYLLFSAHLRSIFSKALILSHRWVAKQDTHHRYDIHHLRQQRVLPPHQVRLFRQSHNCTSGNVLYLNCGEEECGRRPAYSPVPSRIIGGSQSAPGVWPWHVQILVNGKYQCGGSLVCR